LRTRQSGRQADQKRDRRQTEGSAQHSLSLQIPEKSPPAPHGSAAAVTF
jgi:hypothetical protein